MQTDGRHVSPLLSKLVKPETRATSSKRMLMPVSHSVPKLPLPGEETHLRRYNISFVLLDQGEALHLTVRGQAINKHPSNGQIKVLDPDGREVLSQSLALGKAETIKLTAKTAGTYWVTSSFGQNVGELRIANPRVVQFAGRHQQLKVHQTVRPQYFVVAEGQRAQVDVMTESPDDAVRVRLRDPRGKVVADEVLSGSQSISADGTSGVWSVVIEGAEGRPFGGIQIGLAPPLAPYLADAPERLLKDRQ